MAQFLRIIVATPDEASRSLIVQAAAQHGAARVVAEVERAHDLMEVVARRRPHLAFVASDLADLSGFEAAATLVRRYPRLFIAMITPRTNADEVRRAMKAGARECLFEPLSAETVLRVVEDAKSGSQAVVEHKAAIVAVTSSKGGVGKSTIAVNLAIALQQLGVGRVAIVDGDLYFGDLAVLLNIKPERTIHDLNAALDAEIADRFLFVHSTGIEVLAAPSRTEQADEITPEQFRTILTVLQTLYDYIVVDVTVSAFETMLASLDVADVGVVVSTLDVVCLKDVSQVIGVLTKLRFPLHNITLVGNRYDERVSLNPKDAERTLGLRFATVLPRDDRVVIAANRGVPTIIDDPRAPFTQKVQTLAKTIATQVGRVDHVSA